MKCKGSHYKSEAPEKKFRGACVAMYIYNESS